MRLLSGTSGFECYSTLSFLFLSANEYTYAFLNPSLAYGVTFSCPGFTFMEYSVVYWLGPISGMSELKS